MVKLSLSGTQIFPSNLPPNLLEFKRKNQLGGSDGRTKTNLGVNYFGIAGFDRAVLCAVSGKLLLPIGRAIFS